MAKSKKTVFEEREHLALRKQWYAILKAEGFNDIEYTDWNTGASREYTRPNGSYASAADLQRNWTPGKQRYYELMSQRYWDMLGVFPEWECECIRRHAIGEPNAKIARELGVGTMRVSRVIRREKKSLKEQ